MYLDDRLALLPGRVPASTVREMNRQTPEYPSVPESDRPDFARRVILELAREDYFYLWELAARVSQLLDIGADKARSLTAHACAELVVEGSVEVSRTENGVPSPCSEPPALEDSAWDVQTGNVSYEASITAHGNEALDQTWAEERRRGRRWPHII
jgi:hypothetical protein